MQRPIKVLWAFNIHFILKIIFAAKFFSNKDVASRKILIKNLST